MQAYRAYMRDGKLPAPGTVCEIVEKMFPMENMSDPLSSLTMEERNMVDAWKKFTDKVPTVTPHLGMLGLF